MQQNYNLLLTSHKCTIGITAYWLASLLEAQFVIYQYQEHNNIGISKGYGREIISVRSTVFWTSCSLLRSFLIFRKWATRGLLPRMLNPKRSYVGPGPVGWDCRIAFFIVRVTPFLSKAHFSFNLPSYIDKLFKRTRKSIEEPLDTGI